MELAIGNDDVVVGSVGDRFLERGECSLEFGQRKKRLVSVTSPGGRRVAARS